VLEIDPTTLEFIQLWRSWHSLTAL
jgi:phage-related protein